MDPAKQRSMIFKLILGVALVGIALSWLMAPTPPPYVRKTTPTSAAATTPPTAAKAAVPSAPKPPASKWAGGSSGISKMDDSETVVFRLEAENEISGWLEKNRPTLIFRCKERSTDAYITTGMSAQPEYGMMDEATVKVRFDDEKAVSQVWTEATDNKALFAPRAIAFIKRVAKTKTLRVQFTPFNSSPAIMEFDVAGFDDRIDVLAKTCHWPK